MANVYDVAKYILSKTGTISTWKLQKLCYYSQAWHYTWTESPLFQEDFEAWSNGPVCPELFRAHQGLYLISLTNFHRGKIENLTPDQINSIDVVIQDYGSMEPYYLRELTHSEDPWKKARHNLPDNIPSSNVITKESMGDYYGKL